MSYIPGQPVTAVVQRVEIHKLRQGENLILGFSIGGGIDQDPSQNPFSEDKTDKGIYVTRVSEGGPAEIAGLQIGDKIMQFQEERAVLTAGFLHSPAPAGLVASMWLSTHILAPARSCARSRAQGPYLTPLMLTTM
uniref:Tax1-binding protein 3 n=2 Tax=Equus TaxID=9789 RepID=A0A9L0TPZ6_HORSE